MVIRHAKRTHAPIADGRVRVRVQIRARVERRHRIAQQQRARNGHHRGQQQRREAETDGGGAREHRRARRGKDRAVGEEEDGEAARGGDARADDGVADDKDAEVRRVEQRVKGCGEAPKGERDRDLENERRKIKTLKERSQSRYPAEQVKKPSKTRCIRATGKHISIMSMR